MLRAHGNEQLAQQFDNLIKLRVSAAQLRP
jgi:hypothetical protein